MTEYSFERSRRLKLSIEAAFKENQEMLDKLGSDYGTDRVSYWEKYEERLKYMEDNGI
jgi:hypothetical protein